MIESKTYNYPLIEDIMKYIEAPNCETIGKGAKASLPGQLYLTHDNFQYFHYGCDGTNDQGWGCGYRTMQSMCSWVLHRIKKINEDDYNQIPSIKEAQDILVRIDDKPKSFVGSHEWIGAFEIAYILDYLYDVPCTILHIARHENIKNYIREIKEYFEKHCGFIMMGGDIDTASKGIAGLYSYQNDNYLLVVDPHFSGVIESAQDLLSKGYVRWQHLSEFVDTSFYNICLPYA